MLKLSVYLFHHTSFFVVCGTNSVTLSRKSVGENKEEKKRLTRGKLVYCGYSRAKLENPACGSKFFGLNSNTSKKRKFPLQYSMSTWVVRIVNFCFLMADKIAIFRTVTLNSSGCKHSLKSGRCSLD